MAAESKYFPVYERQIMGISYCVLYGIKNLLTKKVVGEADASPTTFYLLVDVD